MADLGSTFPTLWPPLLIAAVVLAVLSALSRPRPLWSILAALPLFYVAFISQPYASDFQLEKFYFVPFLVSLLALSFERLSKTFFWGLFAILIYDYFVYDYNATIFESTTDLTLFGKIYANYTPSLTGILLIALIVISARSANLFVLQNWAEFWDNRKNGGNSDKQTAWLWKALSLWLPMLLFFGAMSLIYTNINTRIVKPCLIAEVDQWMANVHNSNALTHDPAANTLAATLVDPGLLIDISLLDKFKELTQAKVNPQPCKPTPGKISLVIPDVPAVGELPSIPGSTIELPVYRTLDEILSDLVKKLDLVLALRLEVAKSKFDAVNAAGAVTTKDAVRESLNSLPTRLPGTETSRCSWYDVACLLVNGIKSTTNSVYVRQRDRAKEKFVSDADRIADDAVARNVSVADDIKKRLESDSAQVRQNLLVSIDRVSLGLHLISLILSVYSALILTKSFLIVVARVIYNFRPLPPLVDSDIVPRGAAQSYGVKVEIAPGSKEKLFVRRNSLGLNVIEKIRLPQWRSSALSRIFNGCYFLCYIDGPGNDERCDVRVDAPAELVVWSLGQGEEVVFSFGDFVGMSDGVRLRKYVSLRLGSLVLGRVFYHCARGPGKLILRTDSVAILGEKAENEGSMHSGGMVAWSVGSEFFVKSSLTRLDVFFSGCNLRRAPGNLIVYDTSQSKRKVGGLRGIWRMATTFLLPF